MNVETGIVRRLRTLYMDEFGIEYARPRVLLTTEFIMQLKGCRDDSARRLLLGISEKFNEGTE